MSRASDTSHDPAAAQEHRTANVHQREPLHEINEACIELLMLLARHDVQPAVFALIPDLRQDLRNVAPSARRRAAQQIFLLVDMEFRDDEWWQAVKSDPDRTWRTRPCVPGAPKRAMVQLARGTLMLAWHSLRSDPAAVRILFGMSRPVAEIIANLRFSEIERIAERQFRHARPRFEDRPWLWRKLLIAAANNDAQALRDFSIHALQLLAGEIIPRSTYSRPSV